MEALTFLLFLVHVCDTMGYVDVHVNWGGVGHVNVHVHLRGMVVLVGVSTREDAWITSGER